MKVEIQISPDIEEPYAVIYSNQMTEEVQRVYDKIQSCSNVITAIDNEQIIILQPS